MHKDIGPYELVRGVSYQVMPINDNIVLIKDDNGSVHCLYNVVSIAYYEQNKYATARYLHIKFGNEPKSIEIDLNMDIEEQLEERVKYYRFIF